LKISELIQNLSFFIEKHPDCSIMKELLTRIETEGIANWYRRKQSKQNLLKEKIEVLEKQNAELQQKLAGTPDGTKIPH
jgi:hypothetical protein